MKLAKKSLLIVCLFILGLIHCTLLRAQCVNIYEENTNGAFAISSAFFENGDYIVLLDCSNPIIQDSEINTILELENFEITETLVLIKFDSCNNIVWHKAIRSNFLRLEGWTDYDYPGAVIEVDSQGNIYLGTSYLGFYEIDDISASANFWYNDFLLVKWDVTGELQWIKTPSDNGYADSFISDIEIIDDRVLIKVQAQSSFIYDGIPFSGSSVIEINQEGGVQQAIQCEGLYMSADENNVVTSDFSQLYFLNADLTEIEELQMIDLDTDFTRINCFKVHDNVTYVVYWANDGIEPSNRIMALDSEHNVSWIEIMEFSYFPHDIEIINEKLILSRQIISGYKKLQHLEVRSLIDGSLEQLEILGDYELNGDEDLYSYVMDISVQNDQWLLVGNVSGDVDPLFFGETLECGERYSVLIATGELLNISPYVPDFVDEMKQATSLMVYPNPAKNLLNIKLPNQPNEFLMNVYSSIGQELLEFNIPPYSNESTINLRELPPGHYLISFINQVTGESMNTKLIIQR